MLWIYRNRLEFLLSLDVFVSRLDGGVGVRILRLCRKVGILAFVILYLLLISNPFLFLIHRRILVRDFSGGLCHPAGLLSGYCIYGSGHHLVIPYVGHP